MEQKIIEEFLNLNSLINNIEGLENRYNESNEYIKLFENTIEAIKEVMLEDEIIKNDIKYSVDVGNYLKQEGINNIIFNEEAIRSDIGEGPFSVSIEIPMIGRHNLKIMLLIHVLGYHTCINIYTDKDYIRDKLKKLKNEIENIIGKLGEFYIGEEEGEPDNVYFVEIDTTKEDCPEAEVTAQKIIALYNLLKEKITQ